MNPSVGDSQLSIKHFDLLRKDRCETQDKSGGVLLLYFRKSLNCKRRPELEISNIHLSNVLTDHLNILTYIQAWLLLNNMYNSMTYNIHFGRSSPNYIKTEQNSAHNIGLNHTTQKTKVTMTRFYDTSELQYCSQHVICILN